MTTLAQKQATVALRQASLIKKLSSTPAALRYATSPAAKIAADNLAAQKVYIQQQQDLFPLGEKIIADIVLKYSTHPELFPRPNGWTPDCHNPFIHEQLGSMLYFLDNWMPDGSDKMPPALVDTYFLNHPALLPLSTVSVASQYNRSGQVKKRVAVQSYMQSNISVIGHIDPTKIGNFKSASTIVESAAAQASTGRDDFYNPRWTSSYEQRIAFLEITKTDQLFWLKYWMRPEEVAPYQAKIQRIVQNRKNALRGDDFDIVMGDYVMPIMNIVVISLVTSGFGAAGAISSTAVTTVNTAAVIGGVIGAVKTGTVTGALATAANAQQAAAAGVAIAALTAGAISKIDAAIGQTPIGTPSEIFRSFTDIKNIRSSFLTLRAKSPGGVITQQGTPPVAPAGYNPIEATVVSSPVAPQAPAPANVPPHVTGAAIVGLGVLAKLFLLV